ncbi:hypothetical protein HK100_006860 [Physocladia obscura]|uniref:Uncharacterized protein n=1 Tax=Physocladia obscura TaxID=109957 RepID=A0AAD5XIB4_9FUNG|nr:hypothetical protein HK100_006860 [Physocladia obscura]
MPPSAAASVSSGWSLIHDDTQISRKQQTSTDTQYPQTTTNATITATTSNIVPMKSTAAGIIPIPATSSKDRLVISTCIYRFLADCTAPGFPISYDSASIMTPKFDSAFDYIYRIVKATVAPPATLLLSLILADKILLKMKMRDDAMLRVDTSMNDNAFAASSWAQVTVFKEARVVAAWKRWVGDLMNWDFEINEVEWCESFLTANPVIRLLCAQNQFINAQIMSLKDQQRQREFEISAELSRTQLPVTCTIEWHKQQQKILEQQQLGLLPQYPARPFSPQSFIQPRVSSLQAKRSLPVIAPTQQQQYHHFLQQQQQQQQCASRGFFGAQPSQPHKQQALRSRCLPHIPDSNHYDDTEISSTSSSRSSTLFNGGASSVNSGSSASTNSRVSSVIASVVASYRKSINQIDFDGRDSATVSNKYSSTTGPGNGRGWLSATDGFGTRSQAVQPHQQLSYTDSTHPQNVVSTQAHRTQQQSYQSQPLENALQQQRNFPQKQWTSETSHGKTMELSTSLSSMQLSGVTTSICTRTSSLFSASTSDSVAATPEFLGISPATTAVMLAQRNSFSAVANACGPKVQGGSWGPRSRSGNSVGNVSQLQQQQVWSNVASKRQQQQQSLCRCVKDSQTCVGCVSMNSTDSAYPTQQQQRQL